jgi:hypothetical protein
MKLHYNTPHSHLDKLHLLFKRAQNPMDELLSRELHEWIDVSLVPKGLLLSTSTLLKQVAMPADLTLLRNTLFQTDYLSTFADCRSPLQFALFLSMVVDWSGRAGQLIAPSNKKTDNNKHLKWLQIAFFAFPTPAGVTVRANTTFGDLKDKIFNPNKYKVTPLRLLPLSLAGEDSLRMLLVIGLIDGVFEHLTSWDDIQKLRPGPNGTEVNLKQAALHLPVSLQLNFSPNSNSIIGVPTRQEQPSDRGASTVSLDCHRTHPLESIYWPAKPPYLYNSSQRRRLFARYEYYQGGALCSLGHSDSSTTYWSHYRNEISTFDFQAIMHGVQAEDMTMHSSLTLGSALANAPRRLSKKGYEDVPRSSPRSTSRKEPRYAACGSRNIRFNCDYSKNRQCRL